MEQSNRVPEDHYQRWPMLCWPRGSDLDCRRCTNAVLRPGWHWSACAPSDTHVHVDKSFCHCSVSRKWQISSQRPQSNPRTRCQGGEEGGHSCPYLVSDKCTRRISATTAMIEGLSQQFSIQKCSTKVCCVALHKCYACRTCSDGPSWLWSCRVVSWKSPVDQRCMMVNSEHKRDGPSISLHQILSYTSILANGSWKLRASLVHPQHVFW